MNDLIYTLWVFLLDNPSTAKVQTLMTSLKNFIKQLDNYMHLDEEYDSAGFMRLRNMVQTMVTCISERKLQCVLISYSILMEHWIRLYINQRMTKIFFLPKCWYLKFYLSQDKPAVKCANEEFDLPAARIREVIKAFNALYKNQGLNEMIKLWNDRNDKNCKSKQMDAANTNGNSKHISLK